MAGKSCGLECSLGFPELAFLLIAHAIDLPAGNKEVHVGIPLKEYSLYSVISGSPKPCNLLLIYLTYFVIIHRQLHAKLAIWTLEDEKYSCIRGTMRIRMKKKKLESEL